jgi:hypothetical protein
MEEGFLFDGVALQRPDVPPGHPQRAAVIEADLADAAAPGTDEAAVAAGVAFDGPVLTPLNQLAFDRMRVEDGAKRCHALTPRAL